MLPWLPIPFSNWVFKARFSASAEAEFSGAFFVHRTRAVTESTSQLPFSAGQAKFQLGQCFSVAKRLRDQLRAVYNDFETLSAKQFLDELIEWLAAKHLRD